MSPTLCSALLCWTLTAPPTHAIETTEAQRIEAELNLSHRYGSFKAKEWVVFAAQPPELPRQSKITFSMEPTAKAITELGPLGRQLHVARIPAKTAPLEKGFDVKLKYQATLHARKLVPASADAKPVEPLAGNDEKLFLATSNLLDYKSSGFQKWLDEQKLQRGANEDDIAFAKRAYRAVTRSYGYHFDYAQDRRVSQLCTAKKTDCGGMALMFVAALRANNVPARTVAGRWAESNKPGDGVLAQGHVKAEFFANGVGWVPADLSMGAQHDKSAEGLLYFGKDLGDFLTMHIDPDLTVDTYWFGKKNIELLQGVSFWVAGTGNAGKGMIQETWVVKKLMK